MSTRNTKWLNLMLVFLLVCSAMLQGIGAKTVNAADSDFASGTGAVGDPYIIETAEQLDKVRENLDKHFKLGADIDLNVAPYNQGEGWLPIGHGHLDHTRFRGTFDGNGHKITGLMINRPDVANSEPRGLFGAVFNGELKDLTLESVNVTGNMTVGGLVGVLNSGVLDNISISGTVVGQFPVGGIAGEITNSTGTNLHSSADVSGHSDIGGIAGSIGQRAKITNSSASGSISVTAGNAGGLVGYMNTFVENSVKNSWASGSVTGPARTGGLIGKMTGGSVQGSRATGNVWGTLHYTGGLIGDVGGVGTPSVSTSYATGDVSGKKYVGGLIGGVSDNIDADIIMTYATGKVTGDEDLGGLVGKLDTSGVVSDNYYDEVTTGQTDNVGKGTPKSTVEMKQQTTFTNWDFATIWDMPAADYPRLQWEGIGGQPPVQLTGKIYVKQDGIGTGTSWTDAFGTLQEALDAATAGKEIWIAAGTYYPTKLINVGDVRTATFQMKNGVAIFGGFLGTDDNETVSDRDFVNNETILSGNLGAIGVDTDNAYNVFFHPQNMNIDETAILNGVTVTGGNADGEGLRNSGGGMLNHGSSPKIVNVIFSGNKAESYGGGIYSGSSKITLDDVTIKDNKAKGGGGLYITNQELNTLNNVIIDGNTATESGGGMYIIDSSPILNNVKIINNVSETQSGGGMYIQTNGSNPIMTGGKISGNRATNSGGGVSNSTGTSPIFTDVEISDNTAAAGGGMYNYGSNPTIKGGEISGNKATERGGGMNNSSDSSPQLVNVLIHGNKADVGGGGMHNYLASSPSLTNVTISGNDGGAMSNISDSGHAVYPGPSKPHIANSIIWGNSSNITNDGDSKPSFSHSLIQGSISGVVWDASFGTNSGGNLDEDPLFMSLKDHANAPTNDGDYRLQNNSPAINKGDNAKIPAGVMTDLDGNPRIDNGTVDMGAYEFQGAVVVVKTIASVDTIGNITVPIGTDLAGANLPVNVGITLSDTTTPNVNIAWDDGNPVFDGNTAGEYVFKGTLTLVAGVTNPGNLKASVKVIVGPAVVVVDADAPNWPVVGELTITNVATTSLRLSWPMATDNVAVTSYRVYVDGVEKVVIANPELSYDVTGLNEQTTYNFAVQAYDAAGNASVKLEKAATTSATPVNQGGGNSGGNSSGGSGSGYVSSNNTDLQELKVLVNGQTLSLTPAFTAGGTAYKVETEAAEAEFTVKTAHSVAKVKLNGELLDNEQKVTLQEGTNVFELIVEAENGMKKTYTVTIQRNAVEPVIPIIPVDPAPVKPVTFIDISGHWAESFIEQAATAGIIKGYSDGTFKPNNNMTRAQAVSLIVRVFELQTDEAALFKDIGSYADETQAEIAAAYKYGLVKGKNGNFGPANKVTRAQFALMISRAYTLKTGTKYTAAKAPYSDFGNYDAETVNAISMLYELDMATGSNGKFNPSEPTSRAHAAKMLMILLETLK